MVEDKSKIRKKKWFSIFSPSYLGNFELGETPLFDIKSAIGRTLSVNLMNITNDPKKQNTNIYLKITGVNGDKVTTEVIGYRLVEATIRRLVGRAKEKVDDSYAYKTADGITLRISPLIVTRAKTSFSVENALRLGSRVCIARIVSKTKYVDFITDIISGRMQNIIKEELSKIYPLRVFVIRSVKLSNEKITGEIITVSKPEEKKEEEKEEAEEEVKPETAKKEKPKDKKAEPKQSESKEPEHKKE